MAKQIGIEKFQGDCLSDAMLEANSWLSNERKDADCLDVISFDIRDTSYNVGAYYDEPAYTQNRVMIILKYKYEE